MSVDVHPSVLPIGDPDEDEAVPAVGERPPSPPTAIRRGLDGRPRGGAGMGLAVPPPDPRASRVAVHSVSVIGTAGRCTVSVELRRGDDQALAIQEGVWATAVVRRLTAEATLQAITALDPAAGQVGLEAVAVAPVGTRPMAAVVLVEAGPDGEQAYAGSALVRAAGEHDAVARAILDATTRRLSVP